MANISQKSDLFLTSNPTAKYVKEELKKQLIKMNTCIPGVIQSYDVKKNRAVVLPIYKIKLRDEIQLPDGSMSDELPINPLNNVPVLFFGGSNLRISFEPKKDDKGIIFFSQRSLDEWKGFLLDNALPSQHYPKINRKFDLIDGVFLPSVIDKFSPNVSAGAESIGGGLLNNLLSTAQRVTGLGVVTESLERVGREIQSLKDRKSSLESEKTGATGERLTEITAQISSIDNQISSKNTENSGILSQLSGEQSQLNNLLQDQIGSAVENATGQIGSLFGSLTGLGGFEGFIGGKKTSDILGGNKLNWHGTLSAGNSNMTLLEAYEDLHSQVMELTNIVLQLTIALGSATAPPFGGPLVSLTEGLVSISSGRISLQISKLIPKNMLNKLKLRRMLK